jgi:hypothetical protein
MRLVSEAGTISHRTGPVIGFPESLASGGNKRKRLSPGSSSPSQPLQTRVNPCRNKNPLPACLTVKGSFDPGASLKCRNKSLLSPLYPAALFCPMTGHNLLAFAALVQRLFLSHVDKAVGAGVNPVRFRPSRLPGLVFRTILWPRLARSVRMID